MYDTLRDAFTIEMGEFVDEMGVLEEEGTVRTGYVDVDDTHTCTAMRRYR